VAAPAPGPDFIDLFATPVLAADLEGAGELNRELAERLLAEERGAGGIRRSNVGGWHSDGNLAVRPEACFRAVFDAVVAGARALSARLGEAAGAPALPSWRYDLDAWAMIMRSGDYAVLHDHGDAHWSAVYWVDPGDSDPREPLSGRLVLVDPRRRGRPTPGLELFSAAVPIRPAAGALVVFPGWLQHYVHSYRGERPRISISCNVVMVAEATGSGSPP
jgi:uncharacterized protein (TIGR02466 family)